MGKTNLSVFTMQNLSLVDTTDIFVKTFVNHEIHFALLYAPRKCFLAILDNNSKFRNEQNKEIDIEKEFVFEARIFNEQAELRWINETNGTGKTAILCEDSTKKFFTAESKPFQVTNDVVEDTNIQSYLLWGRKHGNASNGWTQFAEARIGSFYVPKEITTEYAQFTVIEYLKEFADGNVAVFEERLTGISEVK